MYNDEFGFLNSSNQIDFKYGIIKAHPEIEQNTFSIRKYLNRDGFIYPPIVCDYNIDLSTLERIEIENSERPAELFKIPPSHTIEIFDPIFSEDCRKWDANFIIQLLAFIEGVRLQFSEWWFDGRIPMKSQNNFKLYPNLLEDFISHSYGKWRDLNSEHKKWFINILFMHNKGTAYTWDWEKFMINYTVFDGIYKLYESINNINNKPSHKDRIYTILKVFSIPIHEEFIKNIYFLRNDLFHQAIWDGGLPSSSEDKYKGYNQQANLRRLNIRAIIALLEFKTPFVKTPWWYINHLLFDRPE